MYKQVSIIRITLRKLGVHIFLLLLMLCVGGWLSSVSADPATFSANLTVNLTFPASIPGTLTVAVGGGPILPNCVVVAIGMAAGVCANPTSAFVPATNTLTFTAGPITGNAGPGFGSVMAISSGFSDIITLTNLTGAPLKVSLGGSYNFNLQTTALPGEFATASVSFQIINTGNGAVLFGPISNTITSPPNLAHAVEAQFGVGLTLPPGATNIRIDPFVEGQASVPEPTALLLLGTGLAGFAMKARKRLKKRKTH